MSAPRESILAVPAWLADNAEEAARTGIRITIIVVVCILVRWLANRAVRRLTASREGGRMPVVLRPLRDRAKQSIRGTPVHDERREQRAAAIGSVLRSSTSVMVLAVGLTLVLGELGINLAPIVASAGVLGVALGFGAQNLVKDFLSGIGLILEDQYGVGDVVDLGEATGTIEGMGLRTTRLRDASGVVWYVRNGEIIRVGNKSQGYSMVLVDVPVAHDSDLTVARRAMQEVGDEVAADEDFADAILATPESLGVEQITAAAIVLRLQVRTRTADQWRVARELRQRIASRFSELDIAGPVPVSGLGPTAGGGPAAP